MFWLVYSGRRNKKRRRRFSHHLSRRQHGWKFELKQAKNDDYHFNLLAGNGQIIMSSEMYKTKASAGNRTGRVY